MRRGRKPAERRLFSAFPQVHVDGPTFLQTLDSMLRDSELPSNLRPLLEAGGARQPSCRFASAAAVPGLEGNRRGRSESSVLPCGDWRRGPPSLCFKEKPGGHQ